jgi:hypothetical protein
MSRRLIAQNHGWWKRPPAQVNADIQSWLDELMPKRDLPALIQNPRVPTFDSMPDGRIDLAPENSGDKIRIDDGARRRHALLHKALLDALTASQHSLTQATDLTETINPVLQALGDRIEDTQPEAFVVYSKALRRDMKARLSPDSFKSPLSERQIDALDVYMDADAVFILQDDWLSAVERAIYDRRFGPVSAEKEELRDLIAAARGLATEAAQDILDTSIANIPDNAPVENPDRQSAGQTVSNFLRKAFGWGVENAEKVEKLEKGAKASYGLIKMIYKAYLKVKDKFPDLAPLIEQIQKWIDKGQS